MEQFLSWEWSQWAVLKIAVLAALVWVVVRFARHLLDITAMRRKTSAATWMRRLFPVLELLIWATFIVWSFRQIFNEALYFSIFFLAVALIALGWLGWYAGRDYIAGIILRAQDVYEPGQHIKVGNYHGRIRKLGYLSIDLEEEDGTILKLPYSKLTGHIHYSKKSSSMVVCQSFILNLPPGSARQHMLQKLHETVLNSPWHVAHKKPQLNTLEENNGQAQVELVLYTYGADGFERLKSQLQKFNENIPA